MRSGIEVFFTQYDDAWSNINTISWNDQNNEHKLNSKYYVNVYSPAGKEAIGISADNGYTLIELPPGRYLVVGSKVSFASNYDSNEVVVNVGCNEIVCVTLIPRSLHRCIGWLIEAMKKHLSPQFEKLFGENQRIVHENISKAIELLSSIEAQIPQEYQQPFFAKEILKSVHESIHDLPDFKK